MKDKSKAGAKGAVREKTRDRRDGIREEAVGKRAAARSKLRGAAGAACLAAALLGMTACNTATPSSKSAATRASGNVTTVNNYIGVPPATNAAALGEGGLTPPSRPVWRSISGLVALGEGGLTINIHDINGTIAQSADTEGGDRTDQTAAPSMAAGITGDAPVKAMSDTVAAFATPAAAGDAAVRALAKRFGLGAATNAMAEAVAKECSGDGCTLK